MCCIEFKAIDVLLKISCIPVYRTELKTIVFSEKESFTWLVMSLVDSLDFFLSEQRLHAHNLLPRYTYKSIF